jgi:hypothetical protein
MNSNSQTIRDGLQRFGFVLESRTAAVLEFRREVNRGLAQRVSAQLSRDGEKFHVTLAVSLLLVIPSSVLNDRVFKDAVQVDFGPLGVSRIGEHQSGWWDDAHFFVKSFEKGAIDWLAAHSDIDALTALVHQGIESGEVVPAPPANLGSRVLGLILNRNRSTPAASRIRPPVYEEFLANIYWDMGNRQAAFDHTKRWISIWKGTAQANLYQEFLKRQGEC